MIFCGVGYGLCTGRLEAMGQAALAGSAAAVETTLGLAAGFLLFGGLIRILEQAGAVRGLTRLLRRPLTGLFGRDTPPEALEAAALNLSANMLGLGNAATPMGIRAARLLTPEGAREPGAALCMLLVINATSVQLLPTGVIALRQAAGSAAPGAILLPSLVASTVSTAIGILLSKLIESRRS